MTCDLFLIENDKTIKQSLLLFKNWLSKHPYLHFNGDENIDEILIYFMRVKKFVMNDAYQSFESMLTFMKSYPQWYENPTPADYEISSLNEAPILFLNNRDSKGRRIIIFRMKYFEKLGYNEMFRKILLESLMISFELKTQLNGVSLIFDLRDFSFNFFTKIPVNYIYEAFKMTRKCPVKIKQVVVIGMSSFIRSVYEVAKNFTSSKIRSRIRLVSNIEDMPKVIDVSYLPKEYGGNASEFLDENVFQEAIPYVNSMNKFEVNFSRIQNFQSVGSFRKLEID